MTETRIFGVAGEELQQVVENAAGQPVESFRISFEYQLGPVKGFNAQKVIPTFYWRGRTGKQGRTIMFIKRNPPQHREAFHYAYLAKHGAPIPRLYGALRDDQGRDILFLEYLDALYDEDWFFSDPERCRRYFSASARFHAIHPEADYMSQLEQKRVDRYLAEALDVLNTVRLSSFRGELGHDLEALCLDNAAALPKLLEIVAESSGRVANMALGLSCCGPLHQCGWRRETGELLFAVASSGLLGSTTKAR